MRLASTQTHISRGWLLIAISFVVLSLGAVVSLCKPVREQPVPVSA